MADVNQRLWRVPGQRTKRKAWGFTIQVPCVPCVHPHPTDPGRPQHTQTACAPCPHRHEEKGHVLHPTGLQQVRRYHAEWTREDAVAEKAKIVLKIERPDPAKLVAPAGVTLAQAADRYCAEKSRKGTIAEDRRLFDKVLLPALGAETPLADLNAARISAFKSQRLGAASPRRKQKDGKPAPIAAASVNRPLALLRHLLRLAAHDWQLLTDIPRIRFEKEPQGRLRWATPEEARRLLDACRGSRNPALVDLVEFTLFTGLRQAEAVELTWDRVDRSRGVIQLEKTKTDKRREIPLNSAADAVLIRRGPVQAGPVFGTTRWDAFRTAWENAVRRAKLADFRFHDLRHTFASWSVQRGASLSEVKDLLGHSSLTMVLRYAHLAPEHLRQAVARLDGVLAPPPPAASAETASPIAQEIAQEPTASGVPAAKFA